MIRIFDILISFTICILLMPIFFLLSFFILTESKGGIFYKQTRVGKNNKDFKLMKFRSMYVGSDKKGLLTVGMKDNRITKSGYYLRKFKLDEFLQFINVLKGDMSIVGPRPEVRKYVDLYNEEQLKVLSVRPGITDYASVEYVNENQLLSKSENPEKLYIEEIMPDKIKLNMKFINNRNIFHYFKIIIITFLKVIKL